MLTRVTLQRLARARLRDAHMLLVGKRYDAAYYLAGYAVECALKAWIAKQTPRHGFPEKKRVDQAHTHNLSGLLSLVDRGSFEAEVKRDEKLQVAWSNVQKWSPEGRYEFRSRTAVDARDMLKSVEDALACLSKFW